MPKKNREVLLVTPENDQMSSIRLYTDNTYEILDSLGNPISFNKWETSVENDIYLVVGFAKNGSKIRLAGMVPNLKELIEWEVVEKWIFE